MIESRIHPCASCHWPLCQYEYSLNHCYRGIYNCLNWHEIPFYMITCCHKFLPECSTCNGAGLFNHPAVSSCFTCNCAGLFSYPTVSPVIVSVCSAIYPAVSSCFTCNCVGLFSYIPCCFFPFQL